LAAPVAAALDVHERTFATKAWTNQKI